MLCSIKRKFWKLWYLYVCRNTIKYARKLGVRIGAECKVLGDPSDVFGSEPWLITLGDHVEISSRCNFITHEGAVWVLRGMDERLKDSDCFSPINVGNNVFIGSGSLILPGVTIGDNVVIGGHSVVAKDVSSNAVYAGVPARQISTIESFNDRIKDSLVETKHLSREGKRKYLKCIRPEWFV